MPAAPLPADEAERLAALHFLGFDPGAERPLEVSAFAHATRLVRAMFGTDAAVTLLDGETQFGFDVAGAEGGPCMRTDRADAFCAHTILQDRVLWSEDLLTDTRFRDSALVRPPFSLRFYAGAPLVCGGRRLGALCAFGPAPVPYHPEHAAQLVHIAAMVSDALELRLSHDALRAAEIARAQIQAERDSLLDLPTTLVFMDRDFVVRRCSRQWVRDYLGEDAPNPVGRSILDLLPDADAFRPQFERALAGEVVRGETPFRGGDGAMRYWRYEAAPWRREAGEVVQFSIRSLDVTELVDARLRTEWSEERLELALEISNTVVWELERGAARATVIGAVERLFGPGFDLEAIGRDMFLGVHPDDRAAAQAAWNRHVETGAPYAAQYRLPRTDGQEVWVAASAEHRDCGPTRPARTIGVVHDITATKRAELVQRRAAEAAEAASRAKDEFLANMSHELRTPLNGVMGLAGALARTALAPDQTEMVGLIESSARTLERLLSDVLDLARIESEAFALAPEPLDIAAFVRGVGTLFQWRARDKGLRFDCLADAALAGPVSIDETRLRQILSNLVANALKFTEHGRVSLTARREGDEAVFEVEDTGIGFDEAFGARLFGRFEQADGSITRRYGGTGLGLAISRSLARRMGGSLVARSTPGQGSVFTLRLPAAPCAPKRPVRAAEPPAPAAPRATPVRVLLAEDHPVNRRVVELILAGAGVELTSVENGRLALDALEAQRFDLVLMDVQMPVMDGVTAIRELRAREAREGAARTPVVAFTANAGADQAAASRDAGADEHLTKPVSADRLLDAVRRLAAPAAAPSSDAPAARQRA